MLNRSPIHLADLRAYNRLAIDATLGLTDLVENMHHNVLRLPGPFAEASEAPARGITGFVYRSVRGITKAVGHGVDGVLGMVAPRQARHVASPSREALIAALNGLVGDHLQATSNPLRITMRMRNAGRTLELDPDALARAIPQAGGHVVVLAHGLCMNDLQWRRNGHDHGAALAADADFTPVYLHYNSGLHVSTNGREFAAQLEALLRAWPVPVRQLSLIGYSMGGLLARSACEHARNSGHAWLASLRDIVFIGTPHGGSPLERGGRRIDALLGASPYTAALSRLGRIRSAGITDLRDANLLDRDWNRGERPPAASPRRGVSLPRGVRCFAIAGSIARQAGSLPEKLVGDGLVPLDSALGLHADSGRSLRLPATHRWVGHGLHHLDLLDSPRVYAQIRSWLTASAAADSPVRRSSADCAAGAR